MSADEKSHVKREGAYLFQRIRDLSSEAGLSPLIEFSGGKGYHFWYFFSPPVQAERARNVLNRIVKILAGDLSAFHLEVFPKQGQLSGKGFGNLVKLPLGVHRLTGKKSYFVDCRDRSVEAQLEFLKKVRITGLDHLKSPDPGAADGKVLVHPRLKEWSADFPSLARLEEMCPPLGQIIAASRQGKALSMREEKVIYQTIGFLPDAKRLVHHLMAPLPEYNPHLVDFKLSRLRGRPLGCKRIHSLLQFAGEACTFGAGIDYPHPLLHVGFRENEAGNRAEKIENLSGALENLKMAISQVERFMR